MERDDLVNPRGSQALSTGHLLSVAYLLVAVRGLDLHLGISMYSPKPRPFPRLRLPLNPRQTSPIPDKPRTPHL